VLPMDFSDPDAIRVGGDIYLIFPAFTSRPAGPGQDLNEARLSLGGSRSADQ